MSPRRSLTTKGLPSRTLRVRSDNRHRLRSRSRGGTVGGLVRPSYDVDVAVFCDPCSTVTRGDAPQAPDGRGHHRLVLDEEASLPIDHQLAGRSGGKRNHWGAARQRLDHHHAEGLLPADRHQQRAGAGEHGPLERAADLAEKADLLAVDVRRHLAVEEGLLAGLNYTCEHEWDTGG